MIYDSIVTARIHDRSACLNGEEVYALDPMVKSDDWQRQHYLKLKMNYRKYQKMDIFSKQGMLALHLLQSSFSDLNSWSESALLLWSKTGCHDSDEAFHRSIDKQSNTGSPAIFVYTLPNILLGEISIKYGLKGEQVCLIGDHDHLDTIKLYLKDWLNFRDMKSIIIGLCEVDRQHQLSEFAFIDCDTQEDEVNCMLETWYTLLASNQNET